MPKQTIQIDKESFQALRKIARVLRISVSQFIEDELAYVVEDIQTGLFGDIAERWFAVTCSSRKRAEQFAERIDAFALEEQFADNQNIGTIATKVVPRKDGRWAIQINELRRPGGPWITSGRRSGGWRLFLFWCSPPAGKRSPLSAQSSFGRSADRWPWIPRYFLHPSA